MDSTIAITALALLAVAAASRLLTGTPVTPAMVFTAVGVVAGPLVLGDIDVSSRSGAVRSLAEATLALVLFSDASGVDLRALRRDPGLPLRLLGVGLPLTIAAGAGAALAIFGGLSVAEAFVLAVMLAPTDAALGQAVVTDPAVPPRIRRGLNVESGLNDGICVPLLLIVLAAAEAGAHLAHGPGRVVLEEIGYGLLGGLGAGALAAAVVVVAGRRELIAPAWRQTVAVAAAFLAYGAAAAAGGSGFIGAFVAGMTFGHLVRGSAGALLVFDEDLGRLLNGLTFIMFGAILLGPALEQVTWSAAAYALLSLTVIRMVPVALALARSGVRRPSVAFLGWFGPRGLASIVFAVIVVEESDLPHVSTILVATYLTIGLSVLLHGLSAAPLAARYARWYANRGEDARPGAERELARTG